MERKDYYRLQQEVPHNRDAETAVIGAIIMDNSVMDEIQPLAPGDFYNSGLRAIYTAMQELDTQKSIIDTVTLPAQLKKDGAPEELVTGESLKQILSAVPTTAGAKRYAEIMREDSRKRKLIHACEAIIEDAKTPGKVLTSVLDAAEKAIMGATDVGKEDSKTTKESIIETFEKIFNTYEHGEASGVPCGLSDIDRILQFRPGEMTIIAGRPSMGKSALALTMLHNIVFKQNRRALFFSIEMSRQTVMERLVSMGARIDGSHFRTRGALTQGELDDAVRYEREMEEAADRFYIDDQGGLTLGELKRKARRLARTYKPDIIFIDYLQLMYAGDGNKNENRNNEIESISRGIRALAKELQVPIIVLSQLNRGVESRADKRPLLSDLRESGAIEQDADAVIMLYRDGYYNEAADPCETEALIRKNRQGETGTVKLMWRPRYTQFCGFARGI